MTTALWIHMALDLGFRLDDLHRLSVGQVYGVAVEAMNDHAKYRTLATAEDIANF